MKVIDNAAAVIVDKSPILLTIRNASNRDSLFHSDSVRKFSIITSFDNILVVRLETDHRSLDSIDLLIAANNHRRADRSSSHDLNDKVKKSCSPSFCAFRIHSAYPAPSVSSKRWRQRGTADSFAPPVDPTFRT